MLCIYGKQTRDFWTLLFLVWSNFLYFGGVFNETIILFTLVGYEPYRPRWLFTISYPTRAHGIIVKYFRAKWKLLHIYLETNCS